MPSVKCDREPDNIQDVFLKGLCTGCGTCSGICPNHAIEMIKNDKKGIYIPKLDKLKCKKCRLCLKACPGTEVDFKNLNLDIFGKYPENIWIGNYRDLLIGHAKNEYIRYYASSGGAISALLIYALEEGIINGAIVTKMGSKNPLEPEVFIAKTKEEIISSMGSIYCPVATNTKIRDVLNSENGDKFAIVGLPCHIHGIRKAQMANAVLKEKIVLQFGLMCSNNTTFLGTEFFLKNSGIKINEIDRFYYRRGGWLPKKKLLLSIKGEEKCIDEPYSQFGRSRHQILDTITFHRYFVIPRCLLCCDHTCELADISFGDPRLPELLKTEKVGISLIASRTEVGEKLLQNAIGSNIIKVEKKIDINTFFKGQNPAFKKKYYSRLKTLKWLGKPVPYYTLKSSDSQTIEYLNLLHYLSSYFSSNRPLWTLLYLNIILKSIFRASIVLLITHYKEWTKRF